MARVNTDDSLSSNNTGAGIADITQDTTEKEDHVAENECEMGTDASQSFSDSSDNN